MFGRLKADQHKFCELYNDRSPPPRLCLSDVITRKKISQAFPLHFACCSDQSLKAGTAWERGWLKRKQQER